MSVLDYRPRYHLHPPTGWMNDPNGAIQWKGAYHLFFQYNPAEAVSRNKHWGHVVSRDMIHWETLPIALAPVPGSYDPVGCFSGTCVDNNGIPTILYTGVRPEVQCLATGTDDLVHWTRFPGNPIIGQPPAGVEVTGFRDPYVWREGDEWLMLIGSGIKDTGPTALLYRSNDLMTWEYCNPIYVGEIDHSGVVWNCPAFFAVDGKHVLIVSGQRIWKPFYFTGRYEHYHFEAETGGLVDYGGNLYAPQVFIDSAGRRILWGWLWEAQQDAVILAQGWAGVMALPRELSLRPDGTLLSKPAPEVACLRRECVVFPPAEITGQLPVTRGEALEIEVTIDPGGAKRAGLSVFCANDGEKTRIGYDCARGTLFIDRSHANLSPVMAFDWPNPDYHEVPLDLHGEPLRLRVFLDRSVIEVFAQDGVCLSSRVYPLSLESDGVCLFAEGGTARASEMRVWQLSL